ncbi:MAG TPA: septal ring lytic transglycosylase RlpA family protein [Solirubrobacteraceae bacterium]|nr:septal ring lytic transglycosylase RlpA family protein [Solirubrobacteraceae bacterium]
MTFTRHAHTPSAVRARTRVALGAALGALALGLPTGALAASAAAPGTGAGTAASPSAPGSGGAGLSSTTTSTNSSGTTTASSAGAGTAAVTPVRGSVSAEGDGIALRTAAAGTLRRFLIFSGSVTGAGAGSRVAIQRAATGAWRTVATATLSHQGTFAARWRASAGGRIAFRAVLLGAGGSAQPALAPGGAGQASPAVAVTVYTDALASVYGPGFYGHRTACGLVLRPDTLGVASRTLKCGTRIAIEYHGESITVPVIDRGPYARGVRWDLTEATAQALADPETETVGAAVL